MPTAKTAAPVRGRTTAAKASATKPATTAAKATPAKAAPAAKVDESTEDLAKVGPIELEFKNETKNYAVFTPPKGTGCVGSFYAPLGTTQVRVMLYGPAEALTE